MQQFSDLMPFEIEALLDALRRDLRVQIAKASSNSRNTIVHGHNARKVKRLLEAINPRSDCRANYDAASLSRSVPFRRNEGQAKAHEEVLNTD
jgi:hypothetical protein